MSCGAIKVYFYSSHKSQIKYFWNMFLLELLLLFFKDTLSFLLCSKSQKFNEYCSDIII